MHIIALFCLWSDIAHAHVVALPHDKNSISAPLAQKEAHAYACRLCAGAFPASVHYTRCMTACSVMAAKPSGQNRDGKSLLSQPAVLICATTRDRFQCLRRMHYLSELRQCHGAPVLWFTHVSLRSRSSDRNHKGMFSPFAAK